MNEFHWFSVKRLIALIWCNVIVIEIKRNLTLVFTGYLLTMCSNYAVAHYGAFLLTEMLLERVSQRLAMDIVFVFCTILLCRVYTSSSIRKQNFMKISITAFPSFYNSMTYWDSQVSQSVQVWNANKVIYFDVFNSCRDMVDSALSEIPSRLSHGTILSRGTCILLNCVLWK